MPRRRLVTDKQYEKLVELLERNPCLALGRDSFGPLATQSISNMWEQVSATLNKIPDGVTKDGHKWRIFWNELKYKTRKKAAKLEKLHQTEPIERLFRKPLNSIDIRVLGIIGYKTEQENEEDEVIIDGQYELDEDDESISSIPQELNLKLEYVRGPVENNTDHMQQDEEDDAHHRKPHKILGITVPRPFVMEIKGEDLVGVPEQPQLKAGEEGHSQTRRQAILKRKHSRQLADRGKVLQPDVLRSRKKVLKRPCRRPEIPPQWVLELEKRRLAVDSQLASALNRLAAVLEKMDAKMS